MNVAENLKKGIAETDFSTAQVTNIEHDLLKVMSKATKRIPKPAPIAPLAEPTNLDELVGDLLRHGAAEVEDVALGCDSLYLELTDANNTYMAELEAVDKIIAATSDAVQNVTSLTQDQASQFVWITDSFNDTTFVDPKSTVLVDTDEGAVTLNPVSLNVISNVDIDLNRTNLAGVPGCNFFVLDAKNPGSADVEPTPTLDKTDSRNISNVTDNNNQTWFEIERNFIPLKQPCRKGGRAFVYQLGSPIVDVKAVTSDFDWKATITYPDGTIDKGKDGAGVYLAEFLDGVDPTNAYGYDAKLELKLTLPAAQPLSMIKVVPFVRDSQGQMFLEKLQVICDGQPITVAKNVDLSIQKTSTTKLQKEILRRTGSSSVGTGFNVPTNRNVSAVVASFVGRPIAVQNGLAHKFTEEQIDQRTQRNYLFFSSVSHTELWVRKATVTTPPALNVSKASLNLTGTLQTVLGSLYNTVQVGSNLNSALAQLSNLSKVGNIQSSAITAGGDLGKALGFLGQAGTIISAVSAVSELVKNAFAVNTTKTVLKEVSGYDIFNGYRSYVAIRDINLTRTQYAESAELFSVKRQFPREVKKVGLIVETDIPADWNKGDWITYYLSTDGINWSSVSPLGETTLEQSFTPATPTMDIYFKAVLKGFSQDIYRAPRLKHYTLQGLPN